MSPRHYDVENFWNFRLEDLQFLLKQCLERGQHLKILGLFGLQSCDIRYRYETRLALIHVTWFGAKDGDHQLPAQSYRRGKRGGRSRCISFRSMPGFMADTDPWWHHGNAFRRSVLHSGGVGPDLWIAGRVWGDAHPVFRWDTRLD